MSRSPFAFLVFCFFLYVLFYEEKYLNIRNAQKGM